MIARALIGWSILLAGTLASLGILALSLQGLAWLADLVGPLCP